MFHKKAYYILIGLIIAISFLLYYMLIWESTRPKRSIIQAENTVQENVNSFLQRINEDRPIEKNEIEKNFISVSGTKDIDDFFIIKYKLNNQKMKYSFLGELIRLNHHIFNDISHNPAKYIMIPSQKNLTDNSYFVINALILLSGSNAFPDSSYGKIFIFPVHGVSLKIYIRGIRIGEKTLLEAIGIDSEGNFQTKETEKIFLTHMVELDPDLKEAPQIKAIIN